jgi:hypothetical protein
MVGASRRRRSSGAHSLFKRVEIAMEIGNVSRGRTRTAESAGTKIRVLPGEFLPIWAKRRGRDGSRLSCCITNVQPPQVNGSWTPHERG